MRPVFTALGISLIATASLAAQDFVRDRETFGTDTLFGPGIIEVSSSGSSIRLELARRGHVLALVMTPTEVTRVVEPRRNESRETNAGRPWLDLFPLSTGTANSATVSAGPSMSRSSARGSGGGSADAQTRSTAASNAAYRGAGNTVALVLVSETKWEMRLIEPLLPRQVERDPMHTARTLATTLTQERPAGTWTGYLVRY